MLGKKFFVSDCEGPISINDNAFEISDYFIEDGGKFFEIISKYDDVLVDILKRREYIAGSTLKFIVPFLKAYRVTDNDIINFSNENVDLIPGADETLNFINSIMPSFIVSTSYNHYINALCNKTGFPYTNTYSTKLNIDYIDIDPDEIELIKDYKNLIVENPSFEFLDNIFFKKISKLKIAALMDIIIPIGGEGKKAAVEDIMYKYGFNAEDLFYIGDSITDVQPLKFANDNHGISVSFNGNEYAIKEAEIAVIADNTIITSVLADIFNRYDRENVIKFIISYNEDPKKAFKVWNVNPSHLDILNTSPLPEVKIINPYNIKSLIDKSSNFRKKLRGKSIGGLG
ncbi:MAG: hypothetical protein PHY59_06940 [Methanobacterium sp.]|nr:hypothetical protein [Methanobacterium sp.]